MNIKKKVKRNTKKKTTTPCHIVRERSYIHDIYSSIVSVAKAKNSGRSSIKNSNNGCWCINEQTCQKETLENSLHTSPPLSFLILTVVHFLQMYHAILYVKYYFITVIPVFGVLNSNTHKKSSEKKYTHKENRIQQTTTTNNRKKKRNYNMKIKKNTLSSFHSLIRFSLLLTFSFQKICVCIVYCKPVSIPSTTYHTKITTKKKESGMNKKKEYENEYQKNQRSKGDAITQCYIISTCRS